MRGVSISADGCLKVSRWNFWQYWFGKLVFFWDEVEWKGLNWFAIFLYIFFFGIGNVRITCLYIYNPSKTRSLLITTNLVSTSKYTKSQKLFVRRHLIEYPHSIRNNGTGPKRELFQNNGIYMLHWFQGKSLFGIVHNVCSCWRIAKNGVTRGSSLYNVIRENAMPESDIT